MFGAGLIKLRGDPCWRDLTCLDYHYETQPMPNPLSWYFHGLPRWALHGGVAVQPLRRVVVPFGFFLPQPFASIAALLTILFQLLLMLSGNLSFLNLLTIVLAIPMLDGRWLAKWLPVTVPVACRSRARWFEYATIGYAAVVVLLSIRPALNLIPPRPAHERQFRAAASGEHLRRVRQHQAATRDEVIVEGTGRRTPSEYADWRAYEFKGKPGDPMRMPPQIAPYHLRTRLADVVRRHVQLRPRSRGSLISSPSCYRATATRCSSAARQSIPLGAAEICAGAAFSLSLQHRRRA